MENRRNMRTVDGSVARPQMPMRQMQQPANTGQTVVKLFLLRTLVVSVAVGLVIGGIWLGVLSILDALHGHQGASLHGLLGWCGDRLWVVYVTGGLLIFWKVVVPALKDFDKWWEEKQDKKSLRVVKEAVASNAGKGFNTKFMDAASGLMMESINPASITPASRTANNYYGIQQEEQQTLLGPARGIDVKDIHIPTFREMLDAGEIGPGQHDLLLCHEVLRDEMTGAYTGELQPWHGGIESTSTNFLGGSSKSGKSTYMAHIAAQGALMNALFCVFDPHLAQADKSVARKLEALSRSFILPPAATNVQVRATLDFLKGEADARVNGRETRYSGRMINVLIDEALAFMARAQQTDNKEVQQLYRDLALFMRALGTEYNKFGMNGVFASQFVTKDAFKLPGGGADFRDGCQSQTLLKLPPNQAQVMRLLDKKDLPGIRSLPPGHGYMGFAEGGEVIRMASGNVTRQDIEYVAQLTQPSPDRTKQYSLPDIPMTPEVNGEAPGSSFYRNNREKTAHFDAKKGTEANGEAPGSTFNQGETEPLDPEEYPEANGEAPGSGFCENNGIADLSTIKTLREIGKRLKNGEDPAAIVKSFGLPYGRATQEMSAVVDMVDKQRKAEGSL